MPIKERIIKELEKGAKKFKMLKIKFKGNKKFSAALDELLEKGIVEEKNGFIRLVKQEKDSKDNKIKKVRPNTETKADPNNLEGTVVKLTENYGFVRVEGVQKDIFVAGKFMMGAIVGDKVELAKVPSKRHQFEGEVVSILQEAKNLVATLEKRNGQFLANLKSCPTLSLTIENKKGDFKAGDVVLVDVFGRGRGHRSLTVKIKENIGQITTSAKSVALLLAQKNIEKEFEPQVIQEANEVIARLDMQTEYQHRTNLTDKCIFTIDSAQTKDIDDAISIEKTENGYNLGVHIADVSHFVRPASFNNQVAFNRGTSIYFGENVIPMLPKEYSNGVCSLNPQVERLAFTCDIILNKNADVVSYKFYKSVIKSKLKGVYSEINTVLDKTATQQINDKYSQVLQSLLLLSELYKKLDKKRDARGSMGIESDEAYIIFDKNGRAVDIKKRDRGESEKIIEECMLLANGCSANLAKKLSIPFVYRVHPSPDPEKLYVLKENLKHFGLRFDAKAGDNLQQEMSQLLDKSRNTNLQQFVHTSVLRSQSKAVYSEIPEGHFGLALEDYAHFTSPIRRFPDLAIHRILTDVVNGVPKDKIKTKYEKFAKAASEQSSKTELGAMQIERDADDIYKAEYMRGHLGEEFFGIVSSVTTFGIYVALENTIEGLVHVSVTKMVNPVLQEGYSLECATSGKKYVIGDKVKVKVLGADIFTGNIDFTII